MKRQDFTALPLINKYAFVVNELRSAAEAAEAGLRSSRNHAQNATHRAIFRFRGADFQAENANCRVHNASGNYTPNVYNRVVQIY